jgi:hypothetical protein
MAPFWDFQQGYLYFIHRYHIHNETLYRLRSNELFPSLNMKNGPNTAFYQFTFFLCAIAFGLGLFEISVYPKLRGSAANAGQTVFRLYHTALLAATGISFYSGQFVSPQYRYMFLLVCIFTLLGFVSSSEKEEVVSVDSQKKNN